MHLWHISLLDYALIDLMISNKLAELTGFEPAISCVTGMCPKPLDDSSAKTLAFKWWALQGLNL